jgi:hypothetical protein
MGSARAASAISASARSFYGLSSATSRERITCRQGCSSCAAAIPASGAQAGPARRCMGGGPSCLEGSLHLQCQEVKHPQGFVPRGEVSHAGVGGLVAQIADQIPAGALLGRAEASPGGRALGVCDGRRLTRASCYPSPRPSVVFTRDGGYKSAYRAFCAFRRPPLEHPLRRRRWTMPRPLRPSEPLTDGPDMPPCALLWCGGAVTGNQSSARGPALGAAPPRTRRTPSRRSPAR